MLKQWDFWASYIFITSFVKQTFPLSWKSQYRIWMKLIFSTTYVQQRCCLIFFKAKELQLLFLFLKKNRGILFGLQSFCSVLSFWCFQWHQACVKLVQLQARWDSTDFLPSVNIKIKRFIARTFPCCAAK